MLLARRRTRLLLVMAIPTVALLFSATGVERGSYTVPKSAAPIPG